MYSPFFLESVALPLSIIRYRITNPPSRTRKLRGGRSVRTMKKSSVLILRLGVHSAILLEVRTRSVQSNAAVDDQLRAGDIARILRQQESGRPGHFVGCAPPFQERLCNNRFFKPFQLLSRKARFLYYRCVDRSGAQHIHPYT